jgi:hypothetical protein
MTLKGLYPYTKGCFVSYHIADSFKEGGGGGGVSLGGLEINHKSLGKNARRFMICFINYIEITSTLSTLFRFPRLIFPASR